jgi:hypothetical protein
MDAQKRCRKKIAGAATGFGPAGPRPGKNTTAEVAGEGWVAAWRKDLRAPRVHFAPVVVSDEVERSVIVDGR